MVIASSALREDYWDSLEIDDQDIEALYNHLLEIETPQTPDELLLVLVRERIRREIAQIELQRSSGGEIYAPKQNYKVGQNLVFSALNWRKGQVTAVRPGQNPDLGAFEVAAVKFENGEEKEFAMGFPEHLLNNPQDLAAGKDDLEITQVLRDHGDTLYEILEEGLEMSGDFVRIAGRWFPQALVVDINQGHLNLAEAVLDMAGGGPMQTSEIIQTLDIAANANPKLVEFSLDLALDRDERFDEVGPAGQILWYLKRLEPPEVLETPVYLRYYREEYDQNSLTTDMKVLIHELQDEQSSQLSVPVRGEVIDSAETRLIFPHWIAGTLPLSPRIASIFPTAYEAPRVRFVLVDGDTGEKFPGWVVRKERYVYGLKDWYLQRGLGVGSLVQVHRSPNPGEVIIQAHSKRAARDWMRTVLVGTDGGIVFATLRQIVQSEQDERMAIAIPDVENLEKLWARPQRGQVPLERVVVNMARELTKLNPQGHVHASELYAAVNLVRRCPPGPLLALLASRPWFVHVGDLHFRFNDSEKARSD